MPRFALDFRTGSPFSPDAAYYVGPLAKMKFFMAPLPQFAAEVRSENDYGPVAERAMRKSVPIILPPERCGMGC